MSVAAQIAMLAIQLGVILFAAKFCGMLMTKIKIPAVLGELVAGIIIGPFVLGSIPLPLHGFENGFFPLIDGPIPVSMPLYGIATIGSIILLFVSGLETDLRMFFRYSVAGTIVGIGGVVFAFAFGAGLGCLAFGWSFMDPRSLFLGILSTATSVGITARILSEKRSIDTPEGTTILAAAVIDDVLGIICLAVVMGIVGASQQGGEIAWSVITGIAVKSFGIWLGVTAVGLICAHRIAKFLKLFKNSTSFAVMSLGLSLLLAGLFEQAGLAMIVGAYVMGLSLSKTDISFAIERQLQPVYQFFVPVFFVVMGMLVDVRVMTNTQVLKIGLIYAVLAVLAKVLGCALPALFMNFNWLGALRIGTGMIPRGEVALIIAGIGATTMMQSGGQEIPVINPQLFGIAIIMTLITTLVAPPLLSMTLSVAKKGVKVEKEDSTVLHTDYSFPSEVVRSFVVNDLLVNFRKEGFRHSAMTHGSDIIHLRRENVSFALYINGTNLTFESNPADVVLIRTVVYETLVEINRSFTELKSLATPGSIDQLVIPAETETVKADKSIRLNRIFGEHPVVTLNAATKEEAINQLVDALAAQGRLTDAELCRQDVLDREKIVTTTMPGGFALPHGRTDGCKELVSIIGICPDGVKSDACDGKPTNIFVLSVCPKDASEPYLRFMSQVAAALSGITDPVEFAQGSPESIRDYFLSFGKKRVR